MNTNFYESELREALKEFFNSGGLRVIGESSAVFKKLAGVYPAGGSKIDWTRVPGSVGRVEEQDDLQAEKFAEFFDEMAAKFALSGDVIYVGDSATDFALGGSIATIRKILPELLSVPQHHYIVGPGCSWCICLTMEGDMDFGLAR
ncbi:hypothetical protein FAZ69_10950 [Trinickia terrae]|uniref:Uncharacterized protein n=1 Tax=Trinickia terrae TaxID=2571161 RepID=A0A4U1I7Y6_9BURK|nr:hypothetical protein [Trinickia terrae]TKC89447.1 hypothetical protein FAZ69_10950 [Trinickia terrae]